MLIVPIASILHYTEAVLISGGSLIGMVPTIILYLIFSWQRWQSCTSELSLTMEVLVLLQCGWCAAVVVGVVVGVVVDTAPGVGVGAPAWLSSTLRRLSSSFHILPIWSCACRPNGKA